MFCNFLVEQSNQLLPFLVAQLENENDDDDFLIDRDTLDLLSDNDADPELLTLLEKGLAGDEDMSITFET